MAVFLYKALGSGGAVQTGELTAADRGDAFRQLERKGLKPIRVSEKAENKKETSSEAKGGDSSRSPARASEREYASGEPIPLKKGEIILFTEELSDMLASGLQLEPALKVLEDRSDKGNIKVAATGLRALVRDGTSFNMALRKVSSSFGPLYCSLAAAGEASGSLDKILKRQAEHMVSIQNIKSQVTGALIYPAFVIFMVILVCLFVLFFLLPQLVDLMKKMPGAKVPKLATVLMGFTEFLKVSWLWILGGITLAFFAFKMWKDNEKNKPVWDEAKFNMPLFGSLMAANFYVLFMETMANLIANGLPLVRCLELARDATENSYAQAKIDKLIEQVGDGRSLSQSLLRTGLFPPVIVDMVVVGEQTGNLDDALANAARRSDKQLKLTISRMMALMMPAILVILAVVIVCVLFLIFSLIGETINNIKR